MLSASAFPMLAAPPQLITNHRFDEPILYRAISDNGLWAVAERRPDYDGGKVINLSDMTYVTITNANAQGENGRPLDVSDDGNTVVGAYGNQDRPAPAVWRRATGEWSLLSFPDARFNGGYAHAVTPDGRWAVGRVMGRVNIYTEMAALWDLSTGEFIWLPNLPTPHVDTYNQEHFRFTSISPDGRYLIGEFSQGGSVIYDRNQEKCITLSGTLADGRTARVSPSSMSPDGHLIFGRASVSGQATSASGDSDTWSNQCVYDMNSGTVTLLRDSGLTDHMTWGVADDGTVYAASGGNGTPCRDFHIYANGYWYPFDQILWQAYGIDYYAQTQYTNTGTPYALSGDGRTFASFVDPNRGEGWVVKFDEPLADACARVDLMSNYAVAPTPGIAMSSLSSIRIGFDRNIVLTGDFDKIRMLDSKGAELAKALGASVQNNIITITFRRKKQPAGEEYLISIPADMIAMEGTPSLRNKEIKISYSGRDDVEVRLAEDNPTEYTLRCLDYSTNYLTLRMESEIAIAENAHAELWADDSEEKVCDLNVGVADKALVIYSTATLPLYRNSDYTVVVPAGTFTDPGGATTTANAEFKIRIHGNWEDEPEDDTTIMSEDFNNGLGNKFMFYEGDHLAPSPAMQAWDFTADTTPWWIAREDVYSDDYAAVSHSMYAGSGKADDWMIIRRMYIPDETCRLQFDSQSYLDGFEDHLRVYAIPSDRIFNNMNQEAISYMKENRQLIYDEVQSPGAEQELLAGDWRHNDISLADYAGKYIYIAFVNENTGGSAIFVDNVSVNRNMTFSLSVSSPASVVAQSEQSISAKLYVNSEALKFENLELSLVDAEDNEIDRFTTPAGVTIDHENPYEFTFSKPLPLNAGQINNYRIGVKGDEADTSFERRVANLLFATTKRAVLEEYSGASCSNCPDGFVVIDRLHADFGDRVIPMAIRAYMGDALTPENADYASLLGLDQLGAPSATVNRRYAGYPIERSAAGDFSYAVGNPENGLWYDFVADELTRASYADIASDCSLSETADEVNVNVNLRFAIDCVNGEYSLFGVLLEDGVETYQLNGRFTSTSPLHADWISGGKYGMETVYPFYCDHVVRNVSHTNLCGFSSELPSNVNAGEVVNRSLSIRIPQRGVKTENCSVAVILVDNQTGYIDNARVVRVGESQLSVASRDAEKFVISAEAEGIRVAGGSSKTQAAIYDSLGRLLGMGEGEDIFLPVSSKGVVILKVNDSNASASKIIIF